MPAPACPADIEVVVEVDPPRRPRQRPGLPRARTHLRGRVRDDRGLVEGIEALIGGFFLILLFLFISQVVVWWHARNILEQAAAEGARVAAAADTNCDDAPDASVTMAQRLSNDWVATIRVDCTGDDDTEGSLMTVTVSGSTPAFLFPVRLGVSATASAPEES